MNSAEFKPVFSIPSFLLSLTDKRKNEKDNNEINFSVDTEFDHEDNKRAFREYEANHGMRIVLPMDRELLDRLLGIVASGTSGAEFQLAFGVKDEQALRQKALTAAVEVAKLNAATLAAAAGVTLGKIVKIEYGWAEFRVSSETYSVRETTSEIAAPDLSPSGVTAAESVTVDWEIS